MEFEITRLGIQFVVAIICAGIANTLIPRRVPGKLIGFIFVGLLGVWLGEWLFRYMSETYSLNYSFLHWHVQQVKIVPAIIGCTVVMYLMKLFMQWGRYER